MLIEICMQKAEAEELKKYFVNRGKEASITQDDSDRTVWVKFDINNSFDAQVLFHAGGTIGFHRGFEVLKSSNY